jgi:hypothetical protein
MELNKITYTDLMRRPKLRKIMAIYHHKESDLQIRCVKWFRVTYPAFAFLLEHPHNEGNAFNRQQQIIANREGVTKGVADLLLHIPTQDYFSLAIEMKTEKGRQSPEQKIFQRYFEAAGGKYVVVRTFEGFCDFVTRYMDDITPVTWGAINAVYKAIDKEQQDEANKQLQKILKK